MRRPFTHTVLVRPTRFSRQMPPPSDKRVEFQSLYGDLIGDQSRNRRICDDVVEAVRKRVGRRSCSRNETSISTTSPIGLTATCRSRDRASRRHGKEAARSHGRGASRGHPAEKGRVILATGRYIGEGFDDARLDTLFLTLPVSWHGTIAQYAGRLHRLYDGKREVRIYDYADLNVPMLARMFDRRCRGYEASDTRSLCPPAPFRAGPQTSFFRRTRSGSATSRHRAAAHSGRCRYASGESVRPRRALDAGRRRGCSAGRSATEAFLYRRLETLPETTGRFQLNVALPIPFDGSGPMEVDLLCADARLAIELDGRQHLADPKPIAAIAGRTGCCSRTATSCCGFLPRTWARISMRCSMRS